MWTSGSRKPSNQTRLFLSLQDMKAPVKVGVLGFQVHDLLLSRLRNESLGVRDNRLGEKGVSALAKRCLAQGLDKLVMSMDDLLGESNLVPGELGGQEEFHLTDLQTLVSETVPIVCMPSGSCAEGLRVPEVGTGNQW